MNLHIRRAVVEDTPRLLELVRELATFERAPDQVTITQEHFEASGFGPNPVFTAIVAESEQGVVGFALYYIRFSTWKGRYLYLEDLLVTETWRRKNVGRLLFERIIEEAKQIDVNGITWQVLEWNEPAIKFYDQYQPVYDREWINCNIHFSMDLA